MACNELCIDAHQGYALGVVSPSWRVVLRPFGCHHYHQHLRIYLHIWTQLCYYIPTPGIEHRDLCVRKINHVWNPMTLAKDHWLREQWLGAFAHRIMRLIVESEDTHEHTASAVEPTNHIHSGITIWRFLFERRVNAGQITLCCTLLLDGCHSRGIDLGSRNIVEKKRHRGTIWLITPLL